MKQALNADNAIYIATLFPNQTKTHRLYRWWFKKEDEELYHRLIEAKKYYQLRPITYRMI